MRLNSIGVALIVAVATASAALSQEIEVQKGLVYGQAGDVELKLDLAKPAKGEGPFPAIVFIHGGGWLGGNRQSFLPYVEKAAKRGYVAVTISYRLMEFDRAKKETTTAKQNFPAQIHDAKAAVRWLRANAEKHHIDPDRIGAMGASAGGHLSLMLATTDADDKLEGASGNADHSSRVQAVVNYFGPTDMKTCEPDSSVKWIFHLFLKGKPADSPELYRAASPATYVTTDDPPVLTLHGDLDKLVPVQQARLFDEKMKAAEVEHKLVILKGQGHGFQGEPNRQAEQTSWDFFETHLKP